MCKFILPWQLLCPHHEHCLSNSIFLLLFFLPSFLESMSLCVSASSGQLVSYFTLSQYLLVSFSMMTATSAMTLFHYGCMYVNLCYFNIRFHFSVYCYVSKISCLCSISVSVVFNIFFLVISDWLSVNSMNMLFILLDH